MEIHSTEFSHGGTLHWLQLCHTLHTHLPMMTPPAIMASVHAKPSQPQVVCVYWSAPNGGRIWSNDPLQTLKTPLSAPNPVPSRRKFLLPSTSHSAPPNDGVAVASPNADVDVAGAIPVLMAPPDSDAALPSVAMLLALRTHDRRDMGRSSQHMHSYPRGAFSTHVSALREAHGTTVEHRRMKA